MMKLIVASALLVQVALSAPVQLPAGVSAAVCPNYPNCFIGHAAPVNTIGPIVPGLEQQFAAEQSIRAQQFALSQDILPQVPGLAAHQAAEAKNLAAQGLVPGVTVHAGHEARVKQAEAELIAIQQQQQHQQTAFTGLVGPSGVIGPSGLVGPAGPLAF